MSDNLRLEIRDARQQIEAAEHMFKTALNTLSKSLQTIAECEDILRQHGLDSLPPCDIPMTEHRRQHRMGTVPKIDSDPELQAFILARIDRMTYIQIAEEVAEHFPKPRRVGKSAIHSWNKRREKATRKFIQSK